MNRLVLTMSGLPSSRGRLTVEGHVGAVGRPQVAVFPPALFVGAMVVGLLLHWWQPIHPFPSWPARGLGAALVVAYQKRVRRWL